MGEGEWTQGKTLLLQERIRQLHTTGFARVDIPVTDAAALVEAYLARGRALSELDKAHTILCGDWQQAEKARAEALDRAARAEAEVERLRAKYERPAVTEAGAAGLTWREVSGG